MPQPSDDSALADDEEPLEADAPVLLEMEFLDEAEPLETPDSDDI